MVRFSSVVGVVLLLFAFAGCAKEPPPTKLVGKGGLFIIEHGKDRVLVYSANCCSAMVTLDDDNPVQLDELKVEGIEYRGSFDRLFIIYAGTQRFLLYDEFRACSMAELDR